jgi:acyl-coenzyme A synthetase/AMP-(fatty) acid ligase
MRRSFIFGARGESAVETTLAARVCARIRTRPGDIALVWRGEEVSYRELGRRADAARDRLDGLGLAPGIPVGVLATKSPDAVALILALLRDRRPFLLPAPDLAAPVLAALFTRAGVGAVLSPGADPAPPPPPDGTATAPPAGTALLLTTSGSTGRPKIVPLPGDAIDRFAVWAADRFGIGPGRTVLNYAPLNFDLCLLDIWATLAAGGRVVLVEAEHATRAAHLLGLLRRHQVHVVQAVPMFYQLLARHPDAGDALTGVEHVIATGDVLPPWCVAELPRLFPRARLHNLYGCTETNDSFLHGIDPAAQGPIPIGAPIDGVRAVLATEDGTVLNGPGIGELYVSTPFQAPGYLDDDATAAAFGPHPAGADDHRYFRSGDLVRRHPDGTLTLEGRTDFQVKVRGVRVNPQEVERALLEHAAVTDAVVVVLRDPVGGNALHAVVRHDGSGPLNTLAVRRHCARLLPRAAIPSVIHLADTQLPRTSTGKPDRARIERTYLERTR